MLQTEILVALLAKKVGERLAALPDHTPMRGARGQRGTPGRDGKDFSFEEHSETIRQWVKELTPKFEDFSQEDIEKIRGAKGRDGKDFSFEEHRDEVVKACKEALDSISDTLKLKFEDLSAEEIQSLRGPPGRNGRDGKDFSFDENKDNLETICRDLVNSISDSLKLKFTDLGEEEIAQLRGPRGRDGLKGRDGRDFDFEEHREFFQGLKPKFSDFTPEERETLRLHFADLTIEEKDTLKLRFHDLSSEDRLSLRGARGARGQRGGQGDKGEKGDAGRDGKDGARGIPGISIRGKAGLNGQNGENGQDAPFVTDIRAEKIKFDEVEFVFEFSDGTAITSNVVKLPSGNNVYISSGGSSSGGGSQMKRYKNGQINPGDFSGSPLKYAVVFAEPWNVEFVISNPVGEDPRFWTMENITKNGFTVNSNSDTPLTGPVMFQTTQGPSGEVFKTVTISEALFTGSPRKYTAIFLNPLELDYVIGQLSSVDTRIWSIEDKGFTSFTINTNADEALTGPVTYTTTPKGES